MKKISLLMLAFILAGSSFVFAQDDEKKDKKKRFRTRQEFVFDLGLNNYLSDGQFPDQTNEQFTIKPWGSWYVSIGNSYLTKIAGPLYLEWGGDINWYNFKFQDAKTIIVKNPTDITFDVNQDASRDQTKSKLVVSYVNVSFVPIIKFGERNSSFRLGAGVYGGYKLGSFAKYVYDVDDQTIKDKVRENYFVENLRYGIRARVGYRDVDLFANYDLNSLFSEGRGPQLNAVSAGFTITDLFD